MKEAVYTSIKSDATIEFIEKKSRFIGHARPVQDVEEAERFIDSIKNLHPSATHNVWAYRLGISGQIQKFSDDGEPSQTAGMPTLDVILKQDITQVVIVTTRYFGGILLGAGGLVRAYSKAAADAIAAAGVVSYGRREQYRFSVAYSEWGALQNHCEKRSWTLKDIDYAEHVTCTAVIKGGEAEDLSAFLQDLTSGRVSPQFVSSIYLPID